MIDQKAKRARRIQNNKNKQDRLKGNKDKKSHSFRMFLQYKDSKNFEDQARKHKNRFFEALEEDIYN